MPVLPPPSEGFEKAPEGNHVARCYEVLDLGTQRNEYQGEVKHQRQIWIGWEILGDERMDDGRPFVIGKRYHLSGHEKSTLRKHLVSWRGKPFSDEDFGRFEVSDVVGAYCLLNVVHEPSKDGTRIYANIEGIAPVPKGLTKPDGHNPDVKLDLTVEGYDPTVFDSLSERMQETIAASPEHLALLGGSVTDHRVAQAQANKAAVAAVADDDSVPF